MTSLLAKYISKKFLGESLKNNFGTEVCLLRELSLHHTNSLSTGSVFRICPRYTTKWQAVKEDEESPQGITTGHI